MKKFWPSFLYLFILPTLLFSQTPSPGSSKEEGEIPDTPTTKEVLDDNIHVLVRGNNVFAFELYNLLKGTSGNLCFSPYSITSAMAIPFTGARGAAQQEIRVTMRYLSQAKQGNEAFQWLNKFYTTPWYLGSNESRLFLADSLWVQRDFPLAKNYSDMINFYFNGGLRFADFERNPDGARYNINTWVREKTNGRIPDEIQKEDINKDSRMILVSGAFLKGVWSFPFNPVLTKESPFFLDEKTTTSVNMMSLSGKFKVYRDQDISVIELPYRESYQAGPLFAMIAILPNSNFGLATIEEKFYYDNWLSWMSGMRDQACIVSLPKFSMLQSFDITSLLSRLGMKFTFSDQADFTGISIKNNLTLTKVIQGAYLSIDEKGSDAVSVNPLSLNDTTSGFPEGAVIFKADHPFLYLIMDKVKGTIIYLGRYTTPSQNKKT